MNLFHSLYMRAVLPRLNPGSNQGVGARWDRFTALEKLSLEENRVRQWASVQAMLRHAYATTPYYKGVFARVGARPEDIKTQADFARLPILTKQDIKENIEEMWSRDFRRDQLHAAATGGTTDTPVPLLRDSECIRERMALRLRFNHWAGLDPGDKVLWVWGARSDFAANPSWRWRLYDRQLMRQVWAPTSLLNEDIMAGYVEEMNKFRPHAIIAYPTPLAIFAEFLLASGRDYHRPRTVICTAEPLLPEQREVIDKAFGLKCFNHYGSRDFGMIAAECEFHDGLHLNPAAVYIEYATGEGLDISEVLVTDLLNRGMPMLRYRVNDCAEPGGQCPCGRGYPIMRALQGRSADNFYLANGDVIPGVAFTNRLIKVCPGIRKMQLVQEEYARFTIRYVPSATFSAADLEQVRAKFLEFLGNNVHVDFESVVEIAREHSGKTRFAISKVAKPALVRARS